MDPARDTTGSSIARPRTVTAYRLDSGRWLELGVWGDETDARIEPFADIPLDITAWWG